MKRIVTFCCVMSAVATQPAFAQRQASREATQQVQMRYQIAQMERVLQGAVEHGARVWRDRFRQMLPADMLLSETVKVRGFRLDGYGVLFDVEVPALETAPLWSFQTLDRNDLGLVSALDSLRAFVQDKG